MVRSNCPKYKVQKPTTVKTNFLGFFQTSTNVNNPQYGCRPFLSITIDGIDCAGFAGSDAQVSIVREKLYEINNHTFHGSVAMLLYADDKLHQENILRTTVEVEIAGRVICYVYRNSFT